MGEGKKSEVERGGYRERKEKEVGGVRGRKEGAGGGAVTIPPDRKHGH
jgi:hypothetical protein